MTKQQKIFWNEIAKGTPQKEAVRIAFPNAQEKYLSQYAYQLNNSKTLRDRLLLIYNSEGVYVNDIIRKIKEGLDSKDPTIYEKFVKIAISQLGLESPKKQEIEQTLKATITQEERDLIQSNIRKQLRDSLN